MKTELVKMLLLMLVICFSVAVRAQEQYDVFYFAVGSAYYEELRDLDAANTAADQMAVLFGRLGAVDGVTVLSTESNKINEERIFEGLDEVIRKVKKSKVRNPLIIFYYAGHGFTSGIDRSHFIPPGDFDLESMQNASQEEWIDRTIAPLSIKEKLDESKVDFLMMIDCCYEGDEKEHEFGEDFVIEYFGLGEMDLLMRQTFEIFAAMNTMVGPDPVIFSCPPGQTVTTEPYDFGDGKTDTAPLCRRAHIVLDRKLKDRSILVSDFLVMMLSGDVDPATSSAFSGWKLDEKNLNYLRVKK